MMRYQEDAPGDWGNMLATETISIQTEQLVMSDACKLFLRSWRTASDDVLLILHGLGGHSGWYIDMGNELAAHNLNVYVVDHRGFGRSGGLAGHIDTHQTYIDDIASIVREIRKRHITANIYLLGHSMGGIFAAHVAAKYGELLTGVIFLNPWVQDSTRTPLGRTLAILTAGFLKSRRPWKVAGGHEGMTGNAEAGRMLQADPYWRRSLTATFLVQIVLMRQRILKAASTITIPSLVLQAETDKVVIPVETRKFYNQLASSDKTWVGYADYYHDTEFEDDRTQMDHDIIDWIGKHSAKKAQL